MVNKAGAGWMEPAGPAAIARPAPPMEGRSGEQVVAAACGKDATETGQGGAPKIGDRTAWTGRPEGGLDPVVKSALKGHAGMPARGGLADLSDAEVKRAVEFMMNSGAARQRWPHRRVARPPRPPTDGKKVYDTACVACHATGVAGAPKFAGKRRAWAPRLKTWRRRAVPRSAEGQGARCPRRAVTRRCPMPRSRPASTT
ncbi:MAG: c-type cytochrome [Betaproteobacteria bacterium]|nr:c-type cytochrome [Betaproteobacteria bacterium]